MHTVGAGNISFYSRLQCVVCIAFLQNKHINSDSITTTKNKNTKLPAWLYLFFLFPCSINSPPHRIPARHSSHAPFAKSHLRCSPLRRNSFLLICWRSLRIFLQAGSHASMPPAHKNIRVNCYVYYTKYPKKCIDIIFRECIMEVQNYFYQRGV